MHPALYLMFIMGYKKFFILKTIYPQNFFFYVNSFREVMGWSHQHSSLLIELHQYILGLNLQYLFLSRFSNEIWCSFRRTYSISLFSKINKRSRFQLENNNDDNNNHASNPKPVGLTIWILSIHFIHLDPSFQYSIY